MRAEPLERGLFDELATKSGRDLTSIFIPTHEKGREVAQDRIRFRTPAGERSDSRRSIADRHRHAVVDIDGRVFTAIRRY